MVSSSPFQRAFVIIAAAVVSVGVVLLALAAWTDYAETLDRTERAAGNVAKLMAEQTEGVISTTDSVLLRVGDMVRVDFDLDALRTSDHAWRRLKEIARSLPQTGNLWVFDPAGHAVLDTHGFPARPIDISDRPHFQRALNSTGLIIGEAIRGRRTGRHLFTLGRAVRDKSGRTVSVLGATVETGYFADLYQSLEIGGDAVLAIFNNDGRALVRYPPLGNEDLGRNFSHLKVFEFPLSMNAGVYRAVSQIDGIDRIFAFRRIENRPLVVVAGLSVTEAFVAWRYRLFRNSAIAGLVMAALLGATAVGYRLMRREQDHLAAVQAALREAEMQRGRAEEANRAKSQFLAAASHDLRQPLQAISLFLDVLASATTGRNREVAEKAKEAMLAGRSLLDALLNLSLLEAGTQKVQIATFSVNDVVNRLHSEFAAQFAARGIGFRCVPCSHTATTDPILLTRILRNLLVNALRYTSAGRVLIGCRPYAGGVRIEVWDTGPGIPADKLDAIFREHYQLDQPQTAAVKGLGLGLSIVAKTADLLGLHISVRSTLGKGSVFRVDIPPAEPYHPPSQRRLDGADMATTCRPAAQS